MNRKLLFTLILFIGIGSSTLKAQEIYNTTSGEIIFGWSNAQYNTPGSGDKLMYENNPGKIQDAVRFTVWFHLYSYWHFDFSKKFGLYTGLGNRNIGFITNEMSSSEDENTGNRYMVKWKRRAYALGIPIGVKFGNLQNGFFVFGGFQYEWMYHYKEKEFLNTGKRKYTEWFSDKVTAFMPSAFIGISFPHGLNIKFTYALDDFMNKSFVDGAGNTPYKYMDSRLMYISLSQSLRWQKNTYEKKEKKEPKIALF